MPDITECNTLRLYLYEISEQAELIYSEKMDLCYLRQKVGAIDWEGVWVMEMFYILIGVVVTWYIHNVKTYWTGSFILLYVSHTSVKLIKMNEIEYILN